MFIWEPNSLMSFPIQAYVQSFNPFGIKGMENVMDHSLIPAIRLIIN